MLNILPDCFFFQHLHIKNCCAESEIQISVTIQKIPFISFSTSETFYFSIQGFLAAGPSAVMGPSILFLLSCSELNRDTLFPGLLEADEGSV